VEISKISSDEAVFEITTVGATPEAIEEMKRESRRLRVKDYLAQHAAHEVRTPDIDTTD
jgi:signal transduction histidine kinase